MPPKGRGRGAAGHKGQRRHFSTPEEVAARREKLEKERQWRERRNDGGDEEDDDDDDEEKSGSSSEEESSEESSGEEVEAKRKGVEGLIEIENPNRVVQKTKKAPAEVVTENESAPQLSRREREEVEKQRNKAHYEKMHAAGLTEQARADLARLAIIRKQREEQARKKAEEKRLADEKAAAAAKK